MQVTAAVTHEKGKIEIETVELAAPREGQVLIKLVACGICHTDTVGIEQIIPVQLPAIFGHEGVGIVEEVGVGVGSLTKGNRVIMTFPSCGQCTYCVDGHPYACDNLSTLFFNGAYNDGKKSFSQNGKEVSTFFGQAAFSTYTVMDARNAVKVDIDSDDELAKLCSLGCGIQSGAGAVLNRVKPGPESSLVIFGCGGVGMGVLMAAKIMGCSKIIAVDVQESRLTLAKELGATHVINGKECDAVDEIKKITGGGANYSFEATGIPALLLQALSCIRRNGVCMLLSVTGPAEVSIPLEMGLLNPSATLMGLTEGAANPQAFIPQLVQFYNEGRLPVDKLCKFYDFKDIKKAFEDSHSGAVIKPVIRF